MVGGKAERNSKAPAIDSEPPLKEACTWRAVGGVLSLMYLTSLDANIRQDGRKYTDVLSRHTWRSIICP